MNKQAKLSQHFSLGELTKTNAKGIDNTPSHAAVLNLKNLCENWLEELRYSYNLLYCMKPGEDYETSKNVKPLLINSGFRSEAVNKAIGGVKGSNHLTGCAVDIHVTGPEQAIRYACILLDIADESKRDFDELLVERSPKGTYWVHFAVRPSDGPSTEHSRASSPTRSLSGTASGAAPTAPNRRKVRFIQT